MAKPGRPKGSKNGRKKRVTTPKIRKLRIEYYSSTPSSEGGRLSGLVDQYGRVMKVITNERGDTDVAPSGVCARATH